MATTTTTTISGTSGSDTITSTDGADKISTGAGNDTIIMTVDNFRDTVDGGTGTDTIDYSKYSADLSVELNKGASSTVIGSGSATSTSDVIVNVENFISGSGDDHLTGSSGDNMINGGAGNDTIDGGAGNDTLFGGSGDDQIYGGSGSDVIDGGSGNDVINGGEGKDTVYGGSGNDIITGSDGKDLLYGGSGNDTIGSNDSLRHGDENGSDTIYGDGKESAGDTGTTAAGNDTIYSGRGSDIIYGDNGDNAAIGGNDVIYAGSGNDKVFGEGGDDKLYGEKGSDILNGGAGNDLIVGGLGADTLTGGAGNDTFAFSAAINALDHDDDHDDDHHDDDHNESYDHDDLTTWSDSTILAMDTITDFQGINGGGGDKIDLQTLLGAKDLEWGGTTPPTANGVWYLQGVDGSGNKVTYVYADINSTPGTPELAIKLTGWHELTMDDFLGLKDTTITINTVAGDDIINGVEDNSAVEISGMTTGVEAGQAVTVTLNNVNYTGSVQADGSWSVSVQAADADALNDTGYTVSASVSDMVGNSASATHNITVDTVRPTATIVVDDTALNSWNGVR